MAPLLDVLVRIGKKLPVIYSSHNVEATHKAAILKEHTIGQTLGRFITELEVRLASVADLIVCCTDMDAKHFSQLCSNTIVIPNGCTAPIGASRNALRHREIKRVGFLGSGHGPNVEAAEFIAEEMAPFFPDITFELIGGVCASLSWALPSNVLLHGMVSESVKSGLMIQWDIGLNPVLSGGGSSLKLPDYLSHGLATLSTPAGARGFAILEHQAGRVATRRNFRSTLADMVRNPVGLERDRINGRQYADSHLSWSAITAQYRERLGALLVAGTSRGSGRKLLVVTYRYTEPPLGGAEEYLIEVLKRLRPQFERLDLAAIDVGHLTNHHHFGCRLSSHGGATLRVGEIFDQALFFDPELLPEPEMLTGSRELERAWCREELTLLAPFAHQMAMQGKLRLFAGFYWPENQEGIIRRWTSPEFSFLIPQSTRAFQMAGFASQEKKVRVSFMRVMHDGKMEVRARFEQTIAPYFRFNIALPEYVGEDALILAFEVDEHHAPGDHRPFGVLLESAWVLLDGHGAWNGQREAIDPLEIGIADLREQYQDELRTDSFERWVGALHYTASRRAPNMEDSFAALRGPHSPRLQAWIANNASNYDAILVQGIPFDVVPRTVETLRALPNRPRIITLPHFHGDDRFYHWRRYCSAFEAADATMLFSSSVAERIGSTANFVCVPGGGIRTDELAVTTAERRFADVHQDKEPFFLVLGRKTGSKGYQRALRAHQELRSLGAKVGLVLIGPDEDGYPVSGEAVYYLGRQPREVICGALSACIALVTMSQSESFGIVLCEAWLFGKPVIANRACYSFRELVDDGETGYLVTTDSELTEAMRNLANRPTERDRMGETGFQNTLHRFTWETVADSCLKVLDGRSESEPHGFPGPS